MKSFKFIKLSCIFCLSGQHVTCPACNQRYGTGRHRSTEYVLCGHAVCLSCMFGSQACFVCAESGNSFIPACALLVVFANMNRNSPQICRLSRHNISSSVTVLFGNGCDCILWFGESEVPLKVIGKINGSSRCFQGLNQNEVLLHDPGQWSDIVFLSSSHSCPW